MYLAPLNYDRFFKKADFDYIETEEEHIELVNRALEGEFIKGKDVGFVEGKDIGFVEGKDVGFVEGKDVGFAQHEEDTVIRLHKKGKTTDEIADLLDIPFQKINAIIIKAQREGKL